MNKICFLALCNVFIYSDASILYKILTVTALQFSILKLINIIIFNWRKTWGNLLSLITCTSISVYFIKNYIYPIMMQNEQVKTFYILIMIGMLALAMLYILMRKRTKYGTEILGQIEGFRNFLENAEKEQLEALVEENPEYFYEILPYTYALGISKKWIKQFETIAIRPPNWYNESNDHFNTNDFSYLYDNIVKELSYSMDYSEKKYYESRTSYSHSSSNANRHDSSSDRSSSSSGGGSSGGGSSGGGSGGRRRKFVVKNEGEFDFSVGIWYNYIVTICLLSLK